MLVFGGKSYPEMVAMVLKHEGRAMRVAEIVAVFLANGWEFDSAVPRSTIAGALKRRRNSVGDVDQPGYGLWQFQGGPADG